MFKVGDKVKCISAGTSRYLKVGKEYTVASLKSGGVYITVREIRYPHTYFPSRFVLVHFTLENK